jgi:DNA-binding HxlR family transcriptional regulator
LIAKSILSTHPLLSDRVRLSIMGVLASQDRPVNFNELIESLELSKGNLSAHMKKLEDENLVKVHKEFVDRKPRTSYECTSAGRAALNNYLEQVQKMLSQTKKGD